jgi:hypothetical protein
LIRASIANTACGLAMTRAEVELGDLGQVIGEPGDPQQQLAQRLQVGGRRPALPEQPRRGADRADQRVRVGVGQRREPGRVVAGPNVTSGPNMWSSVTPIRTSVPPVTIGCTRTLLSRRPNRSASLS